MDSRLADHLREAATITKDSPEVVAKGPAAFVERGIQIAVGRTEWIGEELKTHRQEAEQIVAAVWGMM